MADSDTNYQLDPTERIMNLCRDVYGDRMHEYYLGSPNQDFPEAAMPCVVVQKIAGNARFGATSMDVIQDQINVHLFMNDKDDLEPGSKIDTTLRKMQLWVEGIDPVTGQYKVGTLMERLRKEITLSQLGINQEVDINYDIIPRVEMPTVTQGTVQIVITRQVIVPNRQ